MKRTIIALTSIFLSVLLIPAGHASPDCPAANKFKLPALTFETDKEFTPPDPYYQKFISNFTVSLRDADAKRRPLIYLSATNDAEVLKANADLKSGLIMRQTRNPKVTDHLSYPWQDGTYLLGYSNGAYTKALYDLGANLVISSFFEFSLDKTLWKQENNLFDPFTIQHAGYGNGSYVRFTFEISVSGCSNPFFISTNPVEIQGINTTEISATQINEMINSTQAPMYKTSHNSFYYPSFVERDKFIAGYPNWIKDAKTSLTNFNWSKEFSTQSLQESIVAIGSLTDNLWIVGLNPAGCISYSQENQRNPILKSDCTVGIYMMQEFGPLVQYPRYLLIGTADVKKEKAASTFVKPSVPSAKTSGTSSRTVVKTIACQKQSKILKVTGKGPVCPKGYSEMKKK